ncbi:hypothetical protein [Thermoflexus sp.]|uniref:hypothetical protein n=1 Tax=Thermoflexus sp. TaxID=1969742 RepID=UPI0035E428EE
MRAVHLADQARTAIGTFLRRWGWLLGLALVAGALFPLSGYVIIVPERDGPVLPALLAPRMQLDPPFARPGDEVRLHVTDYTPWAYVLLTVNGAPIDLETWKAGLGRQWTWTFRFTLPTGPVEIAFYHSCHTGCQERGRMRIGEPPPPTPPPLPTKLGLVFPNPDRDWRGRSGWAVELTYARRAQEPGWGIDDLATKVYRHRAKGLRVLVRVDYDYNQSIPPAGDHLALTEYLEYLARLARDDRLQGVYGYILGSSYNGLDQNALAPDRPVTPEWYARVFNGYGEPALHTDNGVQVIRAANPHVRVLVGPIRPWNTDQNGVYPYRVDVPWLNYMNTLVRYIDETARLKAALGIPLAAPDGFAVQAPGRPEAPELGGRGHLEPQIDLPQPEWRGAQAGFRVYREWLDIINAYPSTRGLPVYITSANTFIPAVGVPPAQNYPRGWLSSALSVVNNEPQIQALCWFLDDLPGDTQWENFSLTRRRGRLVDAAEEFEELLTTR